MDQEYIEKNRFTLNTIFKVNNDKVFLSYTIKNMIGPKEQGM